MKIFPHLHVQCACQCKKMIMSWYERLPYMTCIFHTWHVFSVHDMYFLYMTCIFRTWHVFFIHDMYFPYMTCIFRTWHVFFINDMYFPYMTCIFRKWHVFSLHGMYFPYMACIFVDFSWIFEKDTFNLTNFSCWISLY